MTEDICDGSFDTPIERSSKCYLCGKTLESHSWFSVIYDPSINN